ncbi:hypothetical protein ACRRTK_024357 [Alexandromys fortis]
MSSTGVVPPTEARWEVCSRQRLEPAGICAQSLLIEICSRALPCSCPPQCTDLCNRK